MNVIIFIRDSKIMIENSSIDETLREVTESKLIFCKNHNLLMYSKSVLAMSHVRVEEIDDSSSKEDENSNSEDDVSNVEDFKTSFH